MNDEKEYGIIKNAVDIANEIPLSEDVFLLGVLVNDEAMSVYMKKMTLMHAILVQSMQIGNGKRAVRYLAAINALRKKNIVSIDTVRGKLTDDLLRALTEEGVTAHGRPGFKFNQA